MRQLILHLSCIHGVGSATILQLYNAMSPDVFSRLYYHTVRDIQAYGVRPAQAQKIVDGLRDISVRDSELRAIERVHGNYITIADTSYPVYLWNTHMPPPVLYYYGDLACLQHAVACVGSRDVNRYGQRAIDRIIPDVVQHGYTIVSGGARGADTLAHKAALRAGGSTAAVLGGGLAHPYPLRNTRLFHDMYASGGVVITPFAVDTQVQAHHFPVRNRIIAGVSHGVVVVQAQARSGTKITASYALEAGRDVGAIPGHIDDPLSEGVHELLADGARIITSAEDVVTMCGGVYHKHQTTGAQEQVRKAEDDDPIVQLCQTPQQFDVLLDKTQLPFFDLQSRLMQLQIDGKIAQDFSGCWHAC